MTVVTSLTHFSENGEENNSQEETAAIPCWQEGDTLADVYKRQEQRRNTWTNADGSIRPISKWSGVDFTEQQKACLLYTSKRQVVKKDGTVPVMGRITVDGSQTQFSCKLTIDPKLWDTLSLIHILPPRWTAIWETVPK